MAGPYRYLPRIKNGPKPPSLLMVAGKDRLIDERQALELSLRRAEVRRYPRATHATLLGAMSPVLKCPGPVRRDFARWVKGLND